MPIRQLPPNVVNKIAAGEVIERPASVVKELVENAIDAGASRIDVSIEKGGSEVIRIVDNGGGISIDELPLAVASHATSKIESDEDLFRIGTFGFRGEALASIASVSRFLLRSRPHGESTGGEIEVVGGVLGECGPAGVPFGTTVEVRGLFFNTPVRRKFMRTTQTEMGHITDTFTQLALGNPHIHFVLRHNGRMVHDLSRSEGMADRIARFFGADLASELIAVESSDGDTRLKGHVARPSHSRANQRWQYLFLNGRCIRDRSLQHALSEAYRGLLLTGRFPICFLQIETPPDIVDVNVHPTKKEVRFLDGGRLYSQLLGMLRTQFLTSDLKSRASYAESPSATEEDEIEHAAQAQSELVDWAKEALSQQKLARAGDDDGDRSLTSTIPSAFRPFPSTAPLTLNRIEPLHRQAPSPRTSTMVDDDRAASWTSARDATQGSVASELSRADFTKHSKGSPQRAMQIHNRYLIAETDDGIEVIDQHALHERILYEQLRAKVLEGALETQRLLVPEPIDLSATESAAVLENRELLATLGVEVEPFGGGTLLVSAYPAMLANIGPAEVLRGVVEQLIAGGKALESRDLVDELLHMIACKAAVKFGDRLTAEEVDALLKQRHFAQDHHHCPHGRPTVLVFTREELDRQFKRI